RSRDPRRTPEARSASWFSTPEASWPGGLIALSLTRTWRVGWWGKVGSSPEEKTKGRTVLVRGSSALVVLARPMPPIWRRSPRTGRPFGAQFREERLNSTGNCPTCKSPLDHKPSKRLDHHKNHDRHHDDR